MDTPRWRVGRKIKRNVYLDDRPVLVTVGPDAEAFHYARVIVDAMNARSDALPVPSTAKGKE